MGDIPSIPPLERARIKRVPVVPCVHTVFIYQLVDPLPWLPQVGTYQSCIVNELYSLTGRHLVCNGRPTLDVVNRMFERLLSLVTPETIEPISRAQVVARKPDGQSKRRYQRARESLDRFGPNANWARVSAFIKVEKWEENLIAVRKPPRMIQFRSYPYCLEVSRYLIPIEEKFWKTTYNGLRVFAKGMNSFAIAALLRNAFDLFPHPVVYLLDHSKFDACLMRELLESLELPLWMSYSNDPLFVNALKFQLMNYCVTKHGITYDCEGRKMSGEYNTSCGGSAVNLAIINDAIVQANCRRENLGLPHLRYHIIINGDDSVVVAEGDLGLTQADFQIYGMKTDVDTCTEFEHIEFCQCRPILVRPGMWRMVRNPERVMARGTVSVKSYHGLGWAKLVNAMGMSELACNDGIPVLQEFARYLLRSAAVHTKQYLKHEISYRALLEGNLGVEPKPIHDCSRLSFANAFGISPTEQIAIEDSLKVHTSCIIPMSQASRVA
uniref:RNA-directed RNA polymerase n=1 Tax=Switchgrass tombus-like virus 1 TaxID=3233122 RepID=A0AAU8MGR8_9TOMB